MTYDFNEDRGKTASIRTEDLYVKGKLLGVYDFDGSVKLGFDTSSMGYLEVPLPEDPDDYTYTVYEPTFTDKLKALKNGSILYRLEPNTSIKTKYVKVDGRWYTLGYGLDSEVFKSEFTEIVEGE